MKFKQFKLVFFLIVILMIPNTIQAGEITWDDEISAGDHYTWTYEKYELGNHDKNVNINITQGSSVSIDIIQDLSSLRIVNNTCDSINCLMDHMNGSILSLYIQMEIDNQVVDNLSLAKLLPIFLHPITFIDNDGVTTEILSSRNNVEDKNNEFIYHQYSNMPDNYVNRTIIWQKSGILNYLNDDTATFGSQYHIMIKRVGYSSSEDNLSIFSNLNVILLVFSFLMMVKFSNLNHKRR